ncbi:hypothetical protein AB0M58_26965 [Streptomyces bobili]|uniref:fascin domain-containing protein n=1 Tax=Streptomyces bobili TaxID=67280 RepID=UPI003440C228
MKTRLTGSIGLFAAVAATVLSVSGPAVAAPGTADAVSLSEFIDQREAASAPMSALAVCEPNVYLTSRANDRIVAAETNYTGYDEGLLRARSTSVGSMERFTLCDHGSYYTLKSQGNSRYVTTELNYSGANEGLLRARGTSIGGWERYSISCPSYCTIKSQANNRYVSVELNYDGHDHAMLRARSTSVGAWETFR